LQINRFTPGGNYESLERLVEGINDNSNYFTGVIRDTDYNLTKSMTILNQSNRQTVVFERIPASTKFKLKNTNIVPGTIFFMNRTCYRTLMDSESDVIAPGQFYVNHADGVVVSYSVPTIGDSVRYQYGVFPFYPVASPIILHDVSSENFRHIAMFAERITDAGDRVNGLPTELGTDIINELMSVKPMYWGS